MSRECKEKLLEELYLELLFKGPGFGSSIEFWDPTSEAIIIFEQIKGENYVRCKRTKRAGKDCKLSKD